MAANIRDVAKQCRVSVATVSRVLNGKDNVRPETRERVLATTRRLGYRPFPNSDLITTRTAPSVGLILPNRLSFVVDNSFYSLGLAGIQEEIERRHGSFTVVSPSAVAALGETPFHLSALRGVDGVLILCKDLAEDEIAGLEQAGIPCIFVGRYSPMEDAGHIAFDMHGGAEMAVEHLFGLGHRRIGFVGWNRPDSLGGFRDGLKARSLPVREDWIFAISVQRPAVQEFPKVPGSLFRHGKGPTAFLCHNDNVAIEVMRRLRGFNLDVPRHVSIVGFDDVPVASACHPPLTTIRQPLQEMARRGVQKLIETVDSNRGPHREIVQADLVVRESTGPLDEGVRL